MINVNLLRNRKEGQRMIVEPSGASAFISGREVLLAAVFLVLGGAILWFVLSSSPSETPIVATNEGPADEAPVQAAQPQDSGAPAVPAQVPPQAEAPAASPVTPAAASPLSRNTTQGAGTGQVAATPASAGSPQLAARPVDPARVPVASPPARAASAPTRTPAPAPRGGEITLSELRVSNAGGGLEVFAATNALPEYDMFQVDNPSRVVIDLPGVRHEVPSERRQQRVSNSIVKQVRIAQNQLDPPLVRLVLEVDSFPELQVLPRPDGLLINIASQ